MVNASNLYTALLVHCPCVPWGCRHAPVCTVHYTQSQYTASHTTMTLTVYDIRNIALPSHRATYSSPEYGIMVTLIGWLRLFASWITPESCKLPRMDIKKAETHNSHSLPTTPVPSFPHMTPIPLYPQTFMRHNGVCELVCSHVSIAIRSLGGAQPTNSNVTS